VSSSSERAYASGEPVLIPAVCEPTRLGFNPFSEAASRVESSVVVWQFHGVVGSALMRSN
jgi:hypothetical protein